ncbi:MAG: hypothetical protein K8W52_37035 [Deltaproteobacteria bacterium]|nr:hypothetical protein [Deltaproteobacteria bacterium]
MQAFQDAFVAIVADAALRRRFRVEPDAVLDGFALDADARAALRGIPLDELERFARSLVAKRWHEVARIVPLTARVAPSLGERYRAWVAEHPAPVSLALLSPGAAEARRALPALHAALAADDAEARYAADLLAYEVIRATGGELRARYDLDAIAHEVARGLLSVDPEPAPRVYRFGRST